jgi:16S rRNA (guanine527-N7)-methyltransferase
MIDTSLLKEKAWEFGVDLDDYALKRLDKYASSLVETNKHLNLTAITEPDEIVIKHFVDSLTVFKYVDIPYKASIVDVGTGAGFPGAVLQLYRPDLKVSFLDSTYKKLLFIDNALKEQGFVCQIIHLRAEQAGKEPELRESFDFATARAVAGLNTLCEYCLPLVKRGGSFVALKSMGAQEEIDNARNAIKELGGEIVQNTMFDLAENMPRRIVEIKKISQTPTKYPRASAKIASKPL